MVGYLNNNILLLLVFIFLVPSSPTRFKITFEGYEIDQMCSETTDPELCVEILTSNPLAEKSDVPGLGKFLVDYAQHNISDALNLLQPVVKNITDPRSKEIFVSCIEYLKWATTYCGNALQALEIKDKTNFISSLFDVNSLADDIRSDLRLKDVVLVPGLMLKIDTFQNVCDIAMVIANENL